ncbi:MAG: dual specificity protein phosphatase family protein [Blastocatellia bacterium]|nr:dual specificity protein phosphatase family protein [Blastocatellia bacterium]MBK6427405.1 dual specificity protein phosphatase family protein [Blastocatellia bacterium]
MARFLFVRRAVAAVCAAPMFALAVFAGGGGGGVVVAPTVHDSYLPIDVPGLTLSNFGVVDGKLFRGDQPKGDEYRQLKALGVKTVIDLRLDSKKNSRELAEAAGLIYVNIPIDDSKRPTDQDVVTFMKVLDETDGQAYVHCAGGRHRTGSIIAVYRMTQNGWNVDQAYQEMLNYDFYTRWGHGGFKDFVFEYYERMQADPQSVPVACAVPASMKLQIPALK